MMNEPISDQILHQLLKDAADQERELNEIRKILSEYSLRICVLEELIETTRSDGK